MAPLSYTYPNHHSLLTIGLLLLASLATSTLINPFVGPNLSCYPPEVITNKPTAHSCGSAIAGLPQSNQPIDYHLDPATGRIIYNTVLTSIGDPSSALHLPQSSWSGDCAIDVLMPPPAQVAHLLWEDIRQAARALVERCVSDMPTVSSQPGPGGGGTARYGSVLIAIMYTPYTSRPEFAPSRPRSSAVRDFRIGAYYPPGAKAVTQKSREHLVTWAANG